MVPFVPNSLQEVIHDPPENFVFLIVSVFVFFFVFASVFIFVYIFSSLFVFEKLTHPPARQFPVVLLVNIFVFVFVVVFVLYSS